MHSECFMLFNFSLNLLIAFLERSTGAAITTVKMDV